MSKEEKTFYDRVYEVVKNIPFGKVATYGHIANKIGSKGSARMVGYALKNAAHQPDIPAHRVVNRNGLLTGKAAFGNDTLMQQLLENEGLTIENNRVVNFTEFLWLP